VPAAQLTPPACQGAGKSFHSFPRTCNRDLCPRLYLSHRPLRRTKSAVTRYPSQGSPGAFGPSLVSAPQRTGWYSLPPCPANAPRAGMWPAFYRSSTVRSIIVHRLMEYAGLYVGRRCSFHGIPPNRRCSTPGSSGSNDKVIAPLGDRLGSVRWAEGRSTRQH